MFRGEIVIHSYGGVLKGGNWRFHLRIAGSGGGFFAREQSEALRGDPSSFLNRKHARAVLEAFCKKLTAAG